MEPKTAQLSTGKLFLSSPMIMTSPRDATSGKQIEKAKTSSLAVNRAKRSASCAKEQPKIVRNSLNKSKQFVTTTPAQISASSPLPSVCSNLASFNVVIVRGTLKKKLGYRSRSVPCLLPSYSSSNQDWDTQDIFGKEETGLLLQIQTDKEALGVVQEMKNEKTILIYSSTALREKNLGTNKEKKRKRKKKFFQFCC